MGKWLVSIGVFFAVVLFIGMSIFGWVNDSYNTFVRTGNQVEAQWAQVENVYQRRIDLVPSLVEATKGIFEQEREVFGAIANARAHYANPGNSAEQKVAAANQLDSALARLMVIVENYPQLRSSDTVNNLMFEVSGTENRITVERQRYNEAVRIYNTNSQSFIGRFMASFFGFKDKTYFKTVTAGAEFAPKINLSLKETK